MVCPWLHVPSLVLTGFLAFPTARAAAQDKPQQGQQPQQGESPAITPDEAGLVNVKSSVGKIPSDVPSALELARKHFANNNLSAAIAVLEHILATLEPTNVPARMQLGKLYAGQGRLPEAIAQYESILNDDPGNLAAQCALAMVYNQGLQVQKALEIVDPILAKQPDHVDALLAKAQATLKQNVAEGEVLLKRVVELDPANYMAYYLLARTCHVNRRNREAIAYYRKCLGIQVQKGLDPIIGIPTCEFLAKLYLDLGEYEKSIQMAEQALPVTSRRADVNFVLGMAHGMMQHYDKAQEHLAKVVELAPNNFIARLRYAYILTTQNKNEEALVQYEAAKTINPTQPFAYCQIGVLLEQLGRKEEARFAYQKAVDLDPKVSAPYYLYAKFLREEGNTALAVTNLENAIRVDGLDVQSYYVLAQILQASSNAEERKRGEEYMKTFEKLSPRKGDIEMARSAMEISPQRVSGYVLIAECYQNIGRNDDALRTLSAAIAVEPNHPLVLKRRGLLYLSLGKKDEARQDLTKAQPQLPDDADIKTALESLN
ncbi:MAG: tetratricopeptide repeat protein [Planctomycetota bacterium]